MNKTNFALAGLLFCISIWFAFDHATLSEQIAEQAFSAQHAVSNNTNQVIKPDATQIMTPEEETDRCNREFGEHAYLRDASTGFCGCSPGFVAMYIYGEGERCEDPNNVLLIPQ